MTIPYDEQIRDHLAGHDRRVVADPTKRHAAVAVVLIDSAVGEDRIDPAPVDDSTAGRPVPEPGLDGRMVDVSGGAAFLLCRRTSRLKAHAAQWALPGGRLDSGESAVEAALRELDEEVGIKLAASTVLGLLDDYPTRSGYVITPVVIWGGGRLDPRPAPDEVVAVYRVGLHQLQRADSPRFISIPESRRPVVQIPLGNHLIHAPTGAVLLQVRWLCLEGRHDPVDELEQPVFAWQ
jgi:8-oxo-dGTP pyrophosphatase MutT (NUDIX family)